MLITEPTSVQILSVKAIENGAGHARRNVQLTNDQKMIGVVNVLIHVEKGDPCQGTFQKH